MDKVNKDSKSVAGRWPDPISFLDDYKEFAVNIRLITTKTIVEQYCKKKNNDERHLLFYAVTEQFFFAIEMLLAFFHAAVDKVPLDLAKWIYPTKVNGVKYYNLSFMQTKIEDITYEDILQIYGNEFTDLKERQIEELTRPLNKILLYLKDTPEKKEVLGRNATSDMITIYNRCKHKFLAYRYKGCVSFLLPKEIELWLEKIALTMKKGNKPTENPPKDISWLINHVRTPVEYTKLVINRIILRLKKPGANVWISGPGRNEETITLP